MGRNKQLNLQPEYLDSGESFFRINPLTINPDYLPDLFLYERYPKKDRKYRFRCLLTDGRSMPSLKVRELLRSWEVVYLHKKQHTHYRQHVTDNLAYILKHPDLNVKEKAKIFSEASTPVIKDVFDTRLSDDPIGPKTLNRMEDLVSQVFEFITDIESLNGLAELIGHNYETHAHSLKVGWLMAVYINNNRDLFPDIPRSEFKRFIIKAAVAGFLHDIGKIKIPQNILNKKRKLNNLEYLVVQSHSTYSGTLLFESRLPRAVMQAVLYHHENDDGSGYPLGIRGDQIPVLAKITHIADVFEALTSRRPYKEPKTAFEALKIMSGENPFVSQLNQFEHEARENIKAPVETIVRNEPDIKLRQLRERQLMEEEEKKRIEARLRLRDKGMSHCFDRDIIRRFILTMNRANSFDLSGLL